MPSTPSAESTGRYRYAVEGLSPEPCDRSPWVSAGPFADHRYVIETGPDAIAADEENASAIFSIKRRTRFG
jgi:hypothetical protein